MTGWTTPADLVRRLRARYDKGEFLTAFGEGRPWEPLDLPVSGPSAREIGSELDAVRRWSGSWHNDRRFRVETRRVGGRLIGVNELPARAWVDGYEQLWRVLGVAADVEWFGRALGGVRADTGDEVGSRLADWMVRNPLGVLKLRAEWPVLVCTVRWLADGSSEGRYVRQLDVQGADTKFVERHSGVLADILDDVLEAERIDLAQPRRNFAARYGFRRKPDYVRVRTLGAQRLPGGFSEISVRADELASTPLPCQRVIVLENEVTYLAFPELPDAIVLWGQGYSVGSRLGSASWLADRRITYWGDIDTHGFAILNRLRSRFPHVRSILMDRETLLDHERQWVKEDRPKVAQLDRLTPAEESLYRELVENSLGESIRLEQERINFAAVQQAVAAL